MRLPSYLLMPILIIFGLISLFIFFTYASDILPGSNWDTVSVDILSLYPYFIVLAFGLIAFVVVVKK